MTKADNQSNFIDEISRKTLGNYVRKIGSKINDHEIESINARINGNQERSDKLSKKSSLMNKFANKAEKKLKEETMEKSLITLAEEKNLVDFRTLLDETLKTKIHEKLDPEDEDEDFFPEDDDIETDLTEEQLEWIAENITEEEYEQLDEISKEKLGQYINRSLNDVRNANQARIRWQNKSDGYHGQDPKGNRVTKTSKEMEDHHSKLAKKREDGIRSATKRLTKEEVETDETLEEGRGKKGAARHASEPDEWGGKDKKSFKSFRSERKAKALQHEETEVENNEPVETEEVKDENQETES